MVDGIGSSSFARAAIEAALRTQTESAKRIDSEVANSLASGGLEVGQAPKSTSFGDSLSQGLREVNGSINRVDELPADMVAGKVGDFHELAVQIKQAELSFKFAMEVRNKLIDAYRETMRMSV
ncbi:MAG: flagellar hook-basal body complex protein FliE [Planctomycetes bacterium]|nr:flagellar hook-basal body complex protein FliE [Planctomycetota bacterium]